MKFKPLEDCLAIPLRNGLTKPKKVRGQGYKMVNMGELFSTPIIDELEMDRVPLTEKEKVSLLEAGDLLFARQSLVREGAGQCSIFWNDAEEVCFESHIIRCRINRQKADPLFLFYYFQSNLGKSNVDFYVEQGAGAAGIRGTDLLKVLVPDIDVEHQSKVAKTLYQLDRKIKNNFLVNQTLEQMAQAIFKSWFVEFDPVKAKMNGELPEGMDAATALLFPEKLVESGLGLIPEGWKVGELSDLLDFNPKRTLKKGTVAPYLDMKNMPTAGHLALDIYDREMGSGTKFINGDALLARITPCLENGKTAFVDFLEGDQVGWGSTEYIVMRSKSDSYKYFSYFMARFEPFRKFAIQSMTGTSGRQRAQAKTVQTMPFVIPPLSILEKFDELITANMKLIKRHGDENKTLAVLRDTLLPKLLSGDIELNANTNGLQEVNANFDVEEIDSFIASLQKELKEEDTLSLIYDPLYLEPIVTWFENKGALPFSAVLKIDDALESLNRYIPRYYDYNGFSGEQEEVDEKIQDYWGYGEPIYVREVTKYCMYMARKSYLQTMSSLLLSNTTPATHNTLYALRISNLDVKLMGCDISNWFGDICLVDAKEPYVTMKRDGESWILTFPDMGPRNDYSDCVKAGYESIRNIIANAFACSVSVVEI